MAKSLQPPEPGECCRSRHWMWRSLLVFLAVPLVAFGCATAERTPEAEAPTIESSGLKAEPDGVDTGASDLLYLRAGDGSPSDRLLALDTASGLAAREFPLGVPSADWSELYTALSTGDRTSVQAIDPASGKVKRSRELGGAFALPVVTLDGTLGGLSEDGRTLVLEELASPGATTRLAVLNTDLREPTRIVELRGDFSFDALSPDGRLLYLIEHLPPAGSNRYSVRLFDLEKGKLAPKAIADKRLGVRAMEGYAVARATGAGETVYTLYEGGHHPFIHALDTGGRYAFCIDLPMGERARDGTAELWRLVPGGNGLLYAANGGLGIVVEVDTLNYRVLQTRKQLPGADAGVGRPVAGGAALSADGSSLFVLGGKGVVAVSTSDLAPRGHYLADRALESLGLSADGKRLYAVAEDGAIVALDAATGAAVSELGGAGSSGRLVRIEAIA